MDCIQITENKKTKNKKWVSKIKKGVKQKKGKKNKLSTYPIGKTAKEKKK